ncbi:MAG: class I SAM-dependent methyltransferase [Gammaproteobacteria bacterium]|nr:class I SAM-dependent methyltransferase [Gammaproteobacteria bacterium]
MDRIPEPELMNDPAQALAYARADFEQPHSQFIAQFRACFPDWRGAGFVLDLGCGPGDICRRFAQAFPDTVIHGVDAAVAMLHIGRADLRATQLDQRIELIKGYLPGAMLPREHYDAVISNSLLHHLHDPQALWQGVLRYAMPDAPVFVMDLRRPASRDEATALVETYAAGEPEVLRSDFHHSLLAAYRVEEIYAQLRIAGIDWLCVEDLGDRHVIVYGYRPPP